MMIERNRIKDLKPLVEAAKADAAGPKQFAPYLRIYLAGNPLSDAAKSAQLDALKAAGVRYEGHIYPGAGHGFNNDATPARYNKAAADQAWKRTIEWFNQYVRG